MAPVLHIRLLGACQLAYDQQVLTGINTPRLQSLLAYLVLHTGAPQPRQYLSFLLWPDSTEAQARTNLRKLCFQLRQALPDPDRFLQMDNHTLQWKPDAPYTLDVAELRHLLSTLAQEPPSPPRLARVVDLYEGELLPNCSDDWLRPLRQQLQESVLNSLSRLVTLLEKQQAYSDGIRYARLLLRYDPLQEQSYQHLIRLHALNGERASALRTYQDCLRMLKRDLGVAPDEVTTTLYEAVLMGQFPTRQAVVAGNPPAPLPLSKAPTPVSKPSLQPRTPTLPSFLDEQPSHHPMTSAPFVTRTRELVQLELGLARALQGRGQIIFIAGEAGAGKTALVQEFARRAQQTHASLVVATGACHTHAGIGDPYLPFRQVLNLLAGEVEAHYASGSISAENARRLWALTALTAQALADDGPNLVDTFVTSQPLLARLAQFPQTDDCVARLKQLGGQPHQADLVQSRLFAQYTSVLQTLATRQPVLLVLEDLHWADASSVSLLFHLGCSLTNHPLLLVATYRTEELAVGERPHPLEEVINEFRRRHGEVRIQLNQTVAAEGRQFVDALLDTEPNRLDGAFRQALHRHTSGHPLFTVELLRHLQERGGLVQDQTGHWIEGASVNWATLPAKTAGVIEKRIRRLDEGARELLGVASVEGESFTAEVVARVQGLDERALLRTLAHLADRHRLVQSQEEIQVDQRFLARYRFTHALFQHYLYQNLSPGERRLLHGAVANALEALYGELAVAITPQLAYHFTQAGDEEKAVAYLTQAGDWARRLSASGEALHHYQQALTLTAGKAAFDAILARRAQVLLSLFQGHAAAQDYEQLLARAREQGNPAQELTALIGLAEAYYIVALDALDSDIITRVGPLRDAAYALASELGDKRARVRALLAARWLVDSGQKSKEAALAQVEEAIALSQEIGSEQLILESNTSLIYALRLLERYREATAQGEALLHQPEAQRNLPLRKEICYELMWVHYFRGHYARCIDCCAAGIQIAHQIGAPPVQYPTIKALAHLWVGHYAEAWTALQQEVVDESHHLGQAFQELGFGIYYLEVLAHEKALAIFARTQAQGRRLRRIWLENWSRGLYAKALLGCRATRQSETSHGQVDLNQLTALNHDMAQIAAGSVETMIVALAVLMQGELALAVGQLDEALQHATQLEAKAQRLGLDHDLIRALELQIRVHLQMNNPAAVLSIADKTIDQATKLNYLPLVWRLQAAKAQALSQLGQKPAATIAYQAAAVLLEALAATIGDAEVRQGFLGNPLVQSIRAAAQA